jgi:hypothetical protein
MRRVPKPKECGLCKRAVVNSFICRRCAKELRNLLIGEGWPDSLGETGCGQPGIIWYIRRLRETALRQARMEQACVHGGTSYVDEDGHACVDGYGLVMDMRAKRLLARISVTLARWNADLDPLLGTHRHDSPWVSVVVAGKGSGGLDEARARRLAANIAVMRHHCAGIGTLHHDLLEYAKQAWGVINRPNDICCGPCPTLTMHFTDGKPDSELKPCDVLLYAEEHAETVVCPKCRAEHDVAALRQALKSLTRDMLFTGPELLKLMATSLNDKIAKSTFYQLISDGRLTYRGIDGKGAMQYTYADVCEAREKPKPTRRLRAM